MFTLQKKKREKKNFEKKKKSQFQSESVFLSDIMARTVWEGPKMFGKIMNRILPMKLRIMPNM